MVAACLALSVAALGFVVAERVLERSSTPGVVATGSDVTGSQRTGDGEMSGSQVTAAGEMSGSPVTDDGEITRSRVAGEPGLWLSGEELARAPTSGVAWETVVDAARAFDSSMTDYVWQDSTDGTHALAAALVFARTGDESFRVEVADAIERIVAGGYITDRNPSSLGWARSITAWVVASDLIDLAEYRPSVDDDWRGFLAGMPQHPYPGDGGDHLLGLAIGRANNIGSVARTAVTAIAIYVDDEELLVSMAELYRDWVEGSTVRRFDWAETRDRSWQCVPDDPATYRGINSADCLRDGHDLGGILPEEFRRSGTYDPGDFPGENGTKYAWEALGAAVVQAELLRRAGFSEALEWGDRAPLRALDRLDEFHRVADDDGWTFGREAGGGSDDRWIIPLVNDLYDTDFPEPERTGHGRPLSWTDWTHVAAS
ncbi:hypothetical protein [Ilumatobacter sp.]|uniref:hypothetical protein n=1 Tax=Ilumatobacter sp. TaxID=1967498 RepID=UPI003AF6B22C